MSSSETGELKAALKDVWLALPGAVKAVPRALARWAKGVGPRWARLLFLAGIIFVLASLLPAPGYDSAWARDALLGVGGSLVLFGPFYWVTRSINAHVDNVASETKQEFAAVRTEAAKREERQIAEVEALRADVDQRLEDVASSVTARLAEEAEEDEAAFSALRTGAPTREVLLDVLRRAWSLGLIETVRPPRVQVATSPRLYVAFEFGGEWDQFSLRLEDLDARQQHYTGWDPEDDVRDVLTAVGRDIKRYTSEPFDVTALFCGLADLLEVAQRNREARPAVQLCEPQWVISGGRNPVVTVARGHVYTVSLQQLRDSTTINAHVHGKSWADGDSWDEVQLVAQSLFQESESGLWKRDVP